MNVVRENLQNLTTLLKVTVKDADYAGAVDKALREYKRKANVPGFRPGMVPMGVINKMYRKSVVAEEAYRTATNACFDYIEKEKIEHIGDMLPSEQQQQFDFDNNTEHEFIFEIGVAPQVNIALDDNEKVTRYEIKVDDQMRDGYRKNFMRRFGKLIDVEVVEKDEALEVTFDNEQMKVQDAYIGLISMDEADRAPFIGKKVGDTIQVNIDELYKSKSQRAAALQVKEHELDEIDPNFKVEITRIRKFAEPALDAAFFAEAFADGSITDEKGFGLFVDSKVSEELSKETERFLGFAIRKHLIERANLTLPEEFLQRWLFTINEGKFSMEDIEKEFPQFLEMMRWNLIQKHYVSAMNISIEEEDLENEVRSIARAQFAQYGLGDVADEMLAGYVADMMKNQEELRKVQEQLYERKVIEAVTPMVKIAGKKVSIEEFGKVVESAR